MKSLTITKDKAKRLANDLLRAIDEADDHGFPSGASLIEEELYIIVKPDKEKIKESGLIKVSFCGVDVTLEQKTENDE